MELSHCNIYDIDRQGRSTDVQRTGTRRMIMITQQNFIPCNYDVELYIEIFYIDSCTLDDEITSYLLPE